jgi:hypothetical protein
MPNMRSIVEGFAANLPERQSSFAERGCAVPFTAPMLSGARLRRGLSGSSEMVLPALSGRGVYIMGWDACLLHCTPSLHDRQLWDRLASQEQPTPALVRAAAREVARVGYAGRKAQAAVLVALQQQKAVRDAVRDTLAARFLSLGPSAADLLAPMVAILAQAGTGPGQPSDRDSQAAIPKAIVTLGAFCASIAAWSQVARSPIEYRSAAIMLGAAQLTLVVADASLRALWSLVAELPEKLLLGQVRHGEVLPLMAELASRADWLLDGWSMIGALWMAAGPAGRGAVLPELVSLLPVPPLETDDWPGARPEWDILLRARRMAQPSPAWSSFSQIDLIERNEALGCLAS